MYILFQIVASHIVSGSNSLIEELGNYTRYTTEGGGNLFVVKNDNKGTLRERLRTHKGFYKRPVFLHELS